MREAFALSTDANERFDAVVPRSDVLVANRPIDGDTLASVGFEVEVTPAIDLASPDRRLAAYLPRTEPIKRLVLRSGVRIVHIIGPRPVAPFVERNRAPLTGLPAFDVAAIAETTEWHFPNGLVFRVVPGWHKQPPGFEYERTQSEFRELFRRPTAGHAGSNDDGVVVAGFGLAHGLACAFRGRGEYGAQPS